MLVSLRVAALVVCALSGLVGPASAEARWGVDASLGVGQALGPPDSGNWGDGQAAHRVGVAVEVTRRLDGPWLVGGAASTSLEWWDGGAGCGTITEGEVIAVGLLCTLRTLGVHGLAGLEVTLDRHTRLRAAAGAGATAFFLSAGLSDSIERSLAPSAVLELQAIRQAGRDLWLGVAIEGRVLADEGRRTSGVAAFVVAWR